MERHRGLTRRDFLKLAAIGAAAGACRPSLAEQWIPARAAHIEGSIVGAGHETGHLLQQRDLPAVPVPEIRTGVLIAGGGMAGLSAAWKLNKSGERDFLLMELEPDLGGNARSGQNSVTAFPWGAHYITMPDRGVSDTCELLEDLGVITGHAQDGEPEFDEQYLCFAPQERLFIHGRWQEGLFPRLGATPDDLRQLQEFQDAMRRFRNLTGKDGRKAFSIPVDRSSRDPELIALDRLSMDGFMRERGWSSPRLRWYVNYACRDDYGADLQNTSAWAGIHYWASRANSFEENEDIVLTWPEGNGRLVRQIRDQIAEHCRTDALVYRIREESDHVLADVWSVREQIGFRVRCDRAILAVPQFVAGKILDGWRQAPPDHLKEFVYSPWMVANVWIRGTPIEKGAAPAWDNVLYEGNSLGYVIATHQHLAVQTPESVWTYYLPMTQGDPLEARRDLLARTWPEWRDIVLKDLSRAHPGIEDHVTRIDIMLWGHGMIRPRPGFIWGEARQAAAMSRGRITFAHSDLSGISIVEEAISRGFDAARASLRERHS